MINLLKTLFLHTKRKEARNGMKQGYRIRLWKWEKDDCLCNDREVFIVLPGTRQ